MKAQGRATKPGSSGDFSLSIMVTRVTRVYGISPQEIDEMPWKKFLMYYQNIPAVKAMDSLYDYQSTALATGQFKNERDREKYIRDLQRTADGKRK